MFADLHLHTNFSDGTYSPEELVRQAQQQGLGALALTDHDTVEGCARTAVACKQTGIEFIPGTELTAKWMAGNCISGYFIDTARPFYSSMAKFQAVRQNRIRNCRANQRAGFR
jgi:predicted metal-dependent phosphoesterase TrpH